MKRAWMLGLKLAGIDVCSSIGARGRGTDGHKEGGAVKHLWIALSVLVWGCIAASYRYRKDVEGLRSAAWAAAAVGLAIAAVLVAP